VAAQEDNIKATNIIAVTQSKNFFIVGQLIAEIQRK
jgi:hypothetical protein